MPGRSREEIEAREREQRAREQEREELLVDPEDYDAVILDLGLPVMDGVSS